jgi:hypothetical protein
MIFWEKKQTILLLTQDGHLSKVLLVNSIGMKIVLIFCLVLLFNLCAAEIFVRKNRAIFLI